MLGYDNANTEKFQSALPVWGATIVIAFVGGFSEVSIRAPRVGSDAELVYDDCKVGKVSIRAPRVGSDCKGSIGRCRCRCFNPRSPCGERPVHVAAARESVGVSIRAPRVGSDHE